jgi:phospholipase C
MPLIEDLSPIQHIVVVMLENRSFDNVLGWLKSGLPGTYANPNPYDASAPISAQNLASQTIGGAGQEYSGTMIPMVDPGELFGDMAEQILGGDSVPTTAPYDTYPPVPPPPLMQGFTENYNNILGPGSAIAQNNVGDVMNYLTAAQLPVTAFLAQNFAVCDQWFASVPSQTFVNRLFVFCAAPAIITPDCDPSFSAVNDKDYPFNLIDLIPEDSVVELPTICSQLDLVRGSGSTNWKLYFHDYSIAVLTIPYIAGKAQSASNVNVSTFDDSDWGSATPGQLNTVPSTFVDDVTGVNGATLPAFSFIEPRYSRTHAPNHLPPNSNHPGPGDYGIDVQSDPSDPPIDATGGELLLMQVYNLLRSSSYWDSTLLIITYDEHGGVFDHVAPYSPATPPGTVNIGTPPMAIPPAGISSGLISSKDPAAIGFGYTLYGCRVPAIIVSPLVAAGSTIAPESGVFDHSSIVATVWENFRLSASPSTVTSLTARDAAAPTLSAALTNTNSTDAFSGVIVACPTVVIFNSSHLGTSSQTMLTSAGTAATLTITASGTAKDGFGNEKTWLTASAAAGTPGTNLTVVTISVQETLILPSGTYQGTITINGDGLSSLTVPVWLYLS